MCTKVVLPPFCFFFCCKERRWERISWSKSTIVVASSSSTLGEQEGSLSLPLHGLIPFFYFLFARIGAHCFSSLGFRWTLLPMFVFLLCPHSSHVYVCAFVCFLGPQSFAPPLFFPICKGGNAVVEVGRSLPKLQVAFSPHVYVLIIYCRFFSNLCVHSLLFLCVPSCVLWATENSFPFFSFLFIGVGMWWLR
jgi:hypothetical protein